MSVRVRRRAADDEGREPPTRHRLRSVMTGLSTRAPSASRSSPDGDGRSTTRVIVGGTAWYTLAQLVPLPITVVMTPYLIHHLGVDRWGLIALVTPCRPSSARSTAGSSPRSTRTTPSTPVLTTAPPRRNCSLRYWSSSSSSGWSSA